MTAEPKVVEKTPEEIRREDIQKLKAENEKVISLALQRRALLDHLLNGFIVDGQGNRYSVNTDEIEAKIAEKSAELAASRATIDSLKQKIQFKAPDPA